MRYLRLKLSLHKINLQKISSRVKVLLLFLVVLPIMAILGGGILNKLVLIPFLSEQASASETCIAKSSGKIYSFYMLQAGVFTSSDNAQAMVSQMTSAGFKVFSVKDGDVYRVAAGVAADKESLEAYSTSLGESGYITICKSFEINEASMEGSGDGVKDYMYAAGELINTMLDYSVYGKSFDVNTVEKLDDYAEAVRKQYGCIENQVSLEKIKEINSQLLEHSLEYVKYADDADKRTEMAYQCIVSYGSLIKGIMNQ